MLHNIDENLSANESSDDEHSDHQETFFPGTINANIDEILDEWTIDLNTNGTSVTYKIDTGAQVNVLPKQTYMTLFKPLKLHTSPVKLTAYNGSNIPVLGRCIAYVEHRGKQVPIHFIVADTTAKPILGLNTSNKLNIIKRIHAVSEQHFFETFDCFGEIGTLPGFHHITIDPTVQPVIQPPRRIPFALQEPLQKELKKMVDMDIITPVIEPTDWVSSLVVVQKPNGQLRICLDPRDLNKAIKREHYSLPTTEEILANMPNAKYFSKLDASKAFWQIQVDEESSKLLTFNTPHGRYRFKRLPFGIHSASEICQQRIATILEGSTGAMNVQDDIIIWADTQECLHERTTEVLKKIEASGLKLNKQKCLFNQTECTFLGHRISLNGISPDPEKIRAITDMPYPNNIKSLQRFLGTVNYLGKFLPKFSDITAPLRKLMSKDSIWIFEQQHKNTIDQIKELVTTAPVLQYYDPSKQIRVSSDYSGEGLGALLEQQFNDEWHPIAFGSRTLTQAERNYAPIEGETLSIVFACEHFHDYIYGRKFYMCNDHQPLRAAFNKPLNKSPPRLQRFRLRLMKYDFDLHYVRGTSMVVTDTFSRAPISNQLPEIRDSEMQGYVLSILSSMPISSHLLQRIRHVTEADETLQAVKRNISEGWNGNEQHNTNHYQSYKDEMTLINGIIMKGSQIVIPKVLREEIKHKLHAGH
jgi:hypothetical protein